MLTFVGNRFRRSFTIPLPWTERAACRGRTELFFSLPGERPERQVMRESMARALCARCDVREPCQRWARSNREFGFWGGETERERVDAGFRPSLACTDEDAWTPTRSDDGAGR